MQELTGKQRRYLRGLAHHLKPVVMVGNAGVSEGVLGKVEEALDDHELIKLKVGEGCGDDRKAVARAVSEATGAAVAQIIGNMVVLYRARAEDPEIVLP